MLNRPLQKKADKNKPKQSSKQSVRTRSAADVFLSKDNAKHFKFCISQHILKRKYKCKYYFKCVVKSHERTFKIQIKSVREWNKHHKTKHSDIKYTCSMCNKILNIPCSIKDHKYTHNQKPHICGQCNTGFLSASQLSLHMQTLIFRCIIIV